MFQVLILSQLNEIDTSKLGQDDSPLLNHCALQHCNMHKGVSSYEKVILEYIEMHFLHLCNIP